MNLILYWQLIIAKSVVLSFGKK